METRVGSKSSSKLWRYHQILISISMHAACLLFALPKIMCSSVFLFLFAHLLLSTQKGLHWQPHLKSYHLWIRNRLSKYWGRRKTRPKIVHLQRVGSLILHNQALQKDQQMKTVHFHSYWYQWGIGGVPLMFWHLLFLSTARWPRQTELPPSCWAELGDAGQQEGRCQSREIHLHTIINLATWVVQRSKDLIEQFCALDSNPQLRPALLRCYVEGERQQQTGSCQARPQGSWCSAVVYLGHLGGVPSQQACRCREPWNTTASSKCTCSCKLSTSSWQIWSLRLTLNCWGFCW